MQLKSIQQTASELTPFGKVPPVGPDPDTDDEGMWWMFPLCKVENCTCTSCVFVIDFCFTWNYLGFLAANDDSEDSDSRDEEEEEDEMDAIDANQTPNTNSAATIDTSSPDIFN